MKYLLMVLLMLTSGLSTWAHAETVLVPEGIRYQKIAPKVDEKARETLAAALHSIPVDWSRLVSGSGKQRTFLGTFLGIQIAQIKPLSEFNLTNLRSKIPLSKDMNVESMSLVALDSPERARLIELLNAHVHPPRKFEIRKATPEELAIIWFFVSWNLQEPLWIVEGEGKRFAFDFDAQGNRVEWIEDLSKPCIRFGMTTDNTTPCFCMSAPFDGKHAEVGFNEADICAAEGPGEMPAAASNSYEASHFSLAGVTLLQPDARLEALLGEGGTTKIAELTQSLIAGMDSCWPTALTPGSGDIWLATRGASKLKLWFGSAEGANNSADFEVAFSCAKTKLSSDMEKLDGAVILALRLNWPKDAAGTTDFSAPPWLPESWKQAAKGKQDFMELELDLLPLVWSE